MRRRRSAAAVFFDLDGTLLDTAPDLAFALNAVRAERGLAPLPYEHIRQRVSDGSYGLIEAGFGLGRADPGGETLRARLLEIYAANLARETRLFPGMDEVLRYLERHLVPWGIVTNKPGALTTPLVTAMGLHTRSCCVVSGDSLAVRKPHPQPLLHAAGLAGVDAATALYVGDAPRDVQAARAAGMAVLIVAFGYFGRDADPAGWEADAVIETPAQILEWVR